MNKRIKTALIKSTFFTKSNNQLVNGSILVSPFFSQVNVDDITTKTV